MAIQRESDQINILCKKCRRICRQPAHIVLIECRQFLPYPFKIAKHRFDQLELFPTPRPSKKS